MESLPGSRFAKLGSYMDVATQERMKRAQSAANLSLVATILVVAIKLVAAWLSQSISVLSEGLQSTLDVMMSLLAVFTLRYAMEPADADHPYGHGKAELLTSAFQMLVILGSGVFILIAAFHRYQNPQPIEWNWGAIAMGYTLASNTFVSMRLHRVAKETGSATLASEALHLKGDSLTSLGVLIGMIAVGLTQWLPLDPIMAALFSVIAMISAAKQLRAVMHPLMDGAADPTEVAKLKQVLDTHPEVRGYHNLRVRNLGQHRHVELHVMLDDALSFRLAHDIAEQIEDELRAALGWAYVSIHYEPFEAEMEHRAREH